MAEQLTELHRITHALAAQIVRRVAVFHTQGDAQAEGYLSTRAFREESMLPSTFNADGEQPHPALPPTPPRRPPTHLANTRITGRQIPLRVPPRSTAST